MNKYYIKINLSFFGGGEKTEQPTARKRTKARDEGQVAKSPEINTAFLLIVCFFAVRNFAPWMYVRILELFTFNIAGIEYLYKATDIQYFSRFIAEAFLQVIMLAAPLMLLSLGVGLVANIVQVKWHPTLKPLTPKFSKLNPINGLKRMFSVRSVLELFKSLAKLGIIGWAVYTMIMSRMNDLFLLLDMPILQAMMMIGNLAVDLGLMVGGLYLFIAAADYAYQRYKHTKDLKMTKQEVKEEYKQTEGNPQIKGKIRQKMREISMRRMMAEVPGADVIITNPTHYAVALKYDRDSQQAPLCVAKGVDFLAKRIRDLAAENNIEIVEDKQLARAIYNTVDIGREIPPELYQAVAEILAFVYRLKNKAG